MPRPTRHVVLTAAPAHTAEAFAEWRDGIDQFLEWANRLRTGEPVPATVHQVDAVLTAISQGETRIAFRDFAVWAACAGQNILTLVQTGHWHLLRCRWCDRWLLAKDARRVTGASCRRPFCVRATQKQRKAEERKARRDLDRGTIRRANAQRTF